MRSSSIAEADARGTSNVTAIASATPTARHGEATTALKAEPERQLSPTERLETAKWSKSGTAAATQPSKAERRREAKAKGYEGEKCCECGHFSLVRNGTCMKYNTCASTTGCS
jgi:ribonucleoside-diphosphate reductase alpha chain